MITAIISFLSLFFIANNPASATFPVCDVDLAEELVAETSYEKVVEFYTTLESDDFSLEETAEEKPTPRLDAYSKQNYDLIHTHGQNPLVYAIHLAYAEHRPLVLSPDMIWLLILQGFAEHVDLNSEELRDYFVEHEGKKTLCIQRDDYTKGDENFPWPEVFDSFSGQIMQHTDSSLVALITDNYSTTGPTELAAFQVTLMDAMSEYFLYAMQVLCGIPEITLEGTSADWEALEKRTAELGQFELNWWTDQLKPILKEFTAASKGEVNTAFWQDIYKVNSRVLGCAPTTYITGWILKFFPYHLDKRNPWVMYSEKVDSFHTATLNADDLKEKPKIKRQLEKTPIFDQGFRKQRRLIEKVNPMPSGFDLPLIELEDLALGMSSADLLLDYHGERLSYKLQAGFIGIKQDSETLSLRPEISWIVVDTGEKPTAEDEALYEDWINSQKQVAVGGK